MTEFDLPEVATDAPTIEPATLRDEIERGEDVTLLDTRVPSEFEAWKIDGESVDHVNVPYYNFLDEDPDDSVFEPVPDDEELTAVCAKGEASGYVAGVLAERGYDVRHVEAGMEGWARIYDRVELDTPARTDARVFQYQRPSSGCLAYLVVDGDEAAVFDPLRAFAERYVEDADELGADLVYAVDTHIHADHVSGVRELARDFGVEPVVPQPAQARGAEFDIDVTSVEDGDVIQVGDTAVDVIHTPGHTTGMTSYLVAAVLFTGDSLFVDSVARPDLEEGDEGAPDAARQLFDTLQEKIFTLPDETRVAAAHYGDAADPDDDGSYTAPLGELQEDMPALSFEREEFVEFVTTDMPPRPANFEEIIATNLGVETADDEEAFRLELGPNNCAASADGLAGD